MCVSLRLDCVFSLKSSTMPGIGNMFLETEGNSSVVRFQPHSDTGVPLLNVSCLQTFPKYVFHSHLLTMWKHQYATDVLKGKPKHMHTSMQWRTHTHTPASVSPAFCITVGLSSLGQIRQIIWECNHCGVYGWVSSVYLSPITEHKQHTHTRPLG